MATCTPSGAGKVCGGNGCGGSCGVCQPGLPCQPDGRCGGACEPACAGRACGDDGCGGTCGACAAGQACTQGACVAGLPMGEACDLDTDCAEGLACVDVDFLPFPTGQPICTRECVPPASGQPDPCPDGFLRMDNPFFPGDPISCAPSLIPG